jgi:Skp family chaperone for outer membrane proteins
MQRSTLLALAAGAAIAAAAFLAGSAEARRPVVLAAAPTAVGLVNMATVFDRLNEAAEWDVKLKNLEARFIEEGRARSAALEAMDKEIKAMSEGEAKERKLDEFRLKRLQAEAWNGMKELELDREKSLKWQAVYDLIMVDDSRIEITAQRSKDAPPLETQVKAQITQLRVLHSTKTVDVTEKLIVQINNSRPKAG